MENGHILVVDDEPGMLRLVSLYLRPAGYSVSAAGTGAEAVHALEEGDVDLVVLDVGLPDVDGFSVCRHIRRVSDVPVIMLTARSEHRDRLKGFEMGADDYVPKPFNPEELVARVRAVIRRLRPDQNRARMLSVNGMVIDLIERTVTVDGKAVRLRPKEFDLLAELAAHPGKMFSREQLLRAVWGYEAMGTTTTVDVHVLRLRRKLGDSRRESRWILTVWGGGYRFNPSPHGA